MTPKLNEDIVSFGDTTVKVLACNTTREFFEFIPVMERDEQREGEGEEDYAKRLCRTFGFSGVSFETVRRDTYWM